MRYFKCDGGQIKDENGKKMYPVANWERNQHKLYNARDRAFVAMVDSEYGEVECDLLDIIDEMIVKFDSNPQIDGTVYAYYKDYKIMKDIIMGYDVRHGEEIK